MAPCLDVYSLSRRRDRATIDRFIKTYADRAEFDSRTNEQLMVLPIGSVTDENEMTSDEWDWLEINSLSDAIDVGLRHPHRAFTLYLSPRGSWRGAELSFTTDGRVIFGVSIEDAMHNPLVLAEANDAMTQLWSETEGDRAWIACDQPPPLDVTKHTPWNGALAAIDEAGTGHGRTG